MMTNSVDLRKILDTANIDYKLYSSLNSNTRNFLWNCVRFNVPSPSTPFKVGDIVVRKISGNLDCDPYDVPLKWKIVALTYGLIIGRKVTGSKQGRHEVINDIPWIKHSVEVEVDPDYIENILLGSGSFDPNIKRDASLKRRRQASKYNRSISKKITNEEEAEQFLSTLIVGDTLYSSKFLIGLTTEPRIWTIASLASQNINPHFVGLNTPSWEVNLQSGLKATILPRVIVGYFVTKIQPYPISKVLNK